MIKSCYVYLFIIFLTSIKGFSQVNAVGNPSFEDFYNCSLPNYISKAKYWNSIDSSKLGYGGKYFNVCYSTVPFDGLLRYQYPKTGNAFIGATQFCNSPCTAPSIRQYPKNRLIKPLISGNIYCVKMFVNISNPSPFGNDAMQMYFGDATVDTITQCGLPLTFLNAQVKNPTGNIITDTLNWIEVSGTYTANGTEKYLILGNFVPDASVNSTFINGSQPGIWTDVGYDDISVIDFNLPAFAGPDKNINLGDSTFIGRPPEIGLECTWATSTTTIGTGGGLWVKPTSTGTFSYIVTQNICGNIKTDTVNVNVSPGLVSENELFANSISVYPQPAKDVVTISLSNYYESSIEIKIYDLNGRLIRSEEGIVKNGQVTFNTTELNNAVYSIQFINHTGQIANKRLVIAR